MPLLFRAGPFGPERPVAGIHSSDGHARHRPAHRHPAAGRGARHFGPSGTALAKYFAALSEAAARPYRPAFFLITGDLIDAFRYTGAEGQIAAFRRAVQGSPAPLYLTLGNHDIQELGVANGKPAPGQDSAGEARAAWIAAESCFRKGTYYSFEKQVGRTKYVFLMLEKVYSGGEAPPEQMSWLKRELDRAAGAAIILAMHVPLVDDATSQAIRAAAAGRGVVLALAGHTHTNNIDPIAFGEQTVVQVRTAAFGYGETNWRRIRLHQDRIEISATGKPDQVEKSIPVR